MSLWFDTSLQIRFEHDIKLQYFTGTLTVCNNLPDFYIGMT